MIRILLAGAGGFLGAILRYLLDEAVYLFISKEVFPAGTVLVNLLGCLAIGYLVSLFELKHLFTPELRVLLFAGFLGAFTTYSSFAFDTFTLLTKGNLLKTGLYLALQLFLGVGAVWVGMAINRFGLE